MLTSSVFNNQSVDYQYGQGTYNTLGILFSEIKTNDLFNGGLD
jgi:hypothetical protein